MSHYDLGALPPRAPSRPQAPRVPHPPRRSAPKMPPRLPPRMQKQGPVMAQSRALEAKKRENQLRKQAQDLAVRAKHDQKVAKAKQLEIERLRKCVVDCAKAYTMAKEAHVACIRRPKLTNPALVAARAIELQRLTAAMNAALAALQAARAALEKAVREATAIAESPAQQDLPVVQRELEQAKQDTQTETRAAVEAGAPPAALPPPPTPAEQASDTQTSGTAREAEVVAEQTTNAADSAASSGDAAAVDAGAPPAPPPAPGESSPPPAVVEDAAKKAQETVNQAVGAKPGSVLPLLAVAGIAALLIMRRK